MFSGLALHQGLHGQIGGVGTHLGGGVEENDEAWGLFFFSLVVCSFMYCTSTQLAGWLRTRIKTFVTCECLTDVLFL